MPDLNKLEKQLDKALEDETPESLNEWIETKEKELVQITQLSQKWAVGFRHRFHGHGDYAVIVEDSGELIVECPTKEIAEHIVEVHNKFIK